jgi:hypothetical protein
MFDLCLKLLGMIRNDLKRISNILNTSEQLQQRNFEEYSGNLKVTLIMCRDKLVGLVKKYGGVDQAYDASNPLAFSGKQKVIANSLIFDLRDLIEQMVIEDGIPHDVLFEVLEMEFKDIFGFELKLVTYEELDGMPMTAFSVNNGPEYDFHARDEERPFSAGPRGGRRGDGEDHDRAMGPVGGSFRVDKEMQNQLRILENFHLRLRHLELQS